MSLYTAYKILLELSELAEKEEADGDTRQDVTPPAHNTATSGNGKGILPQSTISSESPGILDNNHHYHSQKTGVNDV